MLQPFPTLAEDQRAPIRRVLEAALRAVDPVAAVHSRMNLAGDVLRIGRASYDLSRTGRILVVGGGKAGAAMASAVYQVLGPRIAAGSVNVKSGHNMAPGGWQVRFGGCAGPAGNGRDDRAAPRADTGPVTVVEAGHPIPDGQGLAGAMRMARLLEGLTADDLVIVLISGGGSALLPLPVHAISLADYQALNDLLLRCGADIAEVNAVRKHCSRLQGGGMARLAAPARVAALVLSDVVGAPLDVIASGPTVPDTSTFADACGVLARYGIAGQAPASVVNHLQRGAAGEAPETPKPGDPVFDRVEITVIGDNARAARAAVAEAGRLGFRSALLSTFIQGEAREVGRVMAGLAQGIACGESDYAPPACLVFGGETTVAVRGTGRGGRNQELALAAGIALDGWQAPPGTRIAVVSLGTDGTDGPTDAAGGLASTDTVARAGALGLDARAALANNDSHPILAALGDLIVTGPTQTNVNDLILVFVFRA